MMKQAWRNKLLNSIKLSGRAVGLAGVVLIAVGCGSRSGDGNAAADESSEVAWEEYFSDGSMEGWDKVEGVAEYRIEDGVLIGKTVDGSKNTFLSKGPYGDFELQFEVLCDPKLNSGVQIRSKIYQEDTPDQSKRKRIRPKGDLYGYQCEIDRNEKGTAGNFWDEARRCHWLDSFDDNPEAKSAYKDNEWNQYRIVAKGNRIQSWINGIACADFTDDLDAEGLIGFQVHSIKKGAGPYEVRWRNVKIRKL